jgi:hypothetical protein
MCDDIDRLGEEIGEKLAMAGGEFCLGQDLEQNPTFFVVGLHLVSLDENVENVYEPVHQPRPAEQ